MQVPYTGIAYDSTTYTVYAHEPEICPCCSHSLKPTLLHDRIVKTPTDVPFFYVTYLCTHCHNVFIARFSELVYETRNNNRVIVFKKLDYVAPKHFKEFVFEDCINKLSPTFVNIYNQALKAEHYNLDQIAGVGYRKALEFLIKDFLISQNPEDEEKIKKTPLGNCINNHIESPQLKTVASRATWLGNDQTHYIQEFEDKDINDLKMLITLSVHWITIILLTNDAETIEKPN